MTKQAIAAISEPKLPTISADNLISQAIEKGVPIDTLERLLTLREKMNAEFARSEYFRALSAFQSECPIIKKTKSVKSKDGTVRYKYAPLDDIVKEVSPYLTKNGLSFTIKTKAEKDNVEATTEVHHVQGHSESSSFVVPIAQEAFMNEAQKAGSALQYAKRYSFCNAFGILTGEDDDDAAALGQGQTIQGLYAGFTTTMQAVLDYHHSISVIKESISKEEYSTGAEAWYELPDEIKKALWRAPTKGGPFTTIEREVIKSSGWHESFYGTKPEETGPTKEDAVQAAKDGDFDLARDIASKLAPKDKQYVENVIGNLS